MDYWYRSSTTMIVRQLKYEHWHATNNTARRSAINTWHTVRVTGLWTRARYVYEYSSSSSNLVGLVDTSRSNACDKRMVSFGVYISDDTDDELQVAITYQVQYEITYIGLALNDLSRGPCCNFTYSSINNIALTCLQQYGRFDNMS